MRAGVLVRASGIDGGVFCSAKEFGVGERVKEGRRAGRNENEMANA